MATKKLTKKQTKALLADAKKLRARDEAKAAERGKKLTLSKDFKPKVPARTPPKDTSKRPSSRAFANNRGVIESLVEPEKVPVNNPSTMSGSRDSQRQAFAQEKTGVSKNYKMVDGKLTEISEDEWKQAAKKFAAAEKKIPKGTSLNQVKAARLSKLKSAAVKVQGAEKTLNANDGLSAAERKMAREGNAPARAPASRSTPAPAPVAEAPKAPATSSAPKMTRAERSAANKAKHKEVRAAEEKKWAEQKSAKTGKAPAPAKPKATAAKPAAKPAAKTTAAKPAAPAKTATAKPAATKVAKAAPAPKAKAAPKAKPAATKAPATQSPAQPSAPKSAPAAPAAKAGFGSKLKAYGKSVFSPKSIASEIGGSFAADAIRGDGKSTARNIAATVVDDATTGYAVGKGYGAVAGAAVGLVRGAQAEGKRTGKAPLALPSTPKQGGTFGGKKPATGGSKGPTSRGGARNAKAAQAAAPAKAAAPAQKKASAAPAKKVVQKAAAPVAAPAKAMEVAKANPEKAIAEFEAKLKGAGVISIAGGASGKAQMVGQPMSVTQLQDQFKRKKGPR